MVLTGREKTTIFLSILGADISSRVLRYLPDELADMIAAGINHLPTPSPEALSEVLDEFQGFLSLPEAREEAYPRISPKPAAPKRNLGALLYERPQMIAFLVSLLPPDEKDGVLQSLPRERPAIEELLSAQKTNPLRPKLEPIVREMFGKLF